MPSVSASSWMPSRILLLDGRAGAARAAHGAQRPGSRRRGCRWQSTSRWSSASPGRGTRPRPLLERAHDGRAAGRLRGVNVPAASRSTRPSRWNSWKPLRMRGSSVPPATGDTTCCGKRQPSCSAISKRVGLGALGVVRAQVDVGEAPAVLVGHLRAQAVDVVVVAADGDDARPVDRGAGDLAGLEVVGNEDVARRGRGARRATRRCPARLPVEAHANTVKPSSTARVAATDTTRSL